MANKQKICNEHNAPVNTDGFSIGKLRFKYTLLDHPLYCTNRISAMKSIHKTKLAKKCFKIIEYFVEK